MPNVDIIVPAFNAAAYLAEALESVLNQSYTDWRIILVDDGSTDSTIQIARSYEQRLQSRMLIINQENRGPSAARNAALNASYAPFIALLDADDLWLPDRLWESITRLQADPSAGLAYGLITRIDHNGYIVETFTGNTSDVEGWIAPAIYQRRVDFPCPTITFRRKCVDAVGLFDETMRATEDRDLWLRIALKFKIAFIPRVIAQYRSSSSSASKDFERMADAQLRFIHKHYGSPGCNFIARQKAISRVFKQRADGYKQQGRLGVALRDAYKACGIWPLGEDNWRTAISMSLDHLGLK